VLRSTSGNGQILVKIEACGVCHTDLHDRDGDEPLKPALPFIPGHKGIGIVVALGEGVTAVEVATPRTAALPSTSLLTPNYVAHIPAGLSPVDAAPLICAGITSYKGIR
jgi:propanol-preferring alcohol dehydrogenase